MKPAMRVRPTISHRGLGRRVEWLLAAFAILCLPAVVRAESLDSLNPKGYVNDFAGVLNAQTAQQITDLCTEVDAKAHAQLTIVTIHSLEGMEAPDYANRLFKRWGVGYKGDNRGVLVLLATDDRKYWVEVGYGLEPILPDGKVGGFGREAVPSLRAGDYNGAVLLLASRVAQVIAADRGVTLSGPAGQLPPPPTGNEGSGPQLTTGQWVILILVLLVVGPILFRLLGPLFLFSILTSGFGGGRRGGSWGSGGFGGGGGFGGFGGGASGGGGAGGGW